MEVPKFSIYVEKLNKKFDVDLIGFLYKYVNVFDDGSVRRINFNDITTFTKKRVKNEVVMNKEEAKKLLNELISDLESKTDEELIQEYKDNNVLMAIKRCNKKYAKAMRKLAE